MKRSIRKKVDPNPVTPRGESAFEEKRIECEFTLLYTSVSKMGFETFKDATDYIFRHGYFTGKTAGKREGLGPPSTETLNTSPSDASVRETAGAIKEKQNGVAESD